MQCPDCEGRGWNLDNTTMFKENCQTCRGSGDVPECDKCDGDGQVMHTSTLYKETCPKCDGKGWLPR
jgi:DnaJ-class molecular chaperone